VHLTEERRRFFVAAENLEALSFLHHAFM
jgi:hypothetical protein